MWGGAFRFLIFGLLFGVAAAALYVLHDSSEEEIRKIRMVRGEIPGAQVFEGEVISLESVEGKTGGRTYTVHYRMKGDADSVHAADLPRVPWSRLKKSAPLKIVRLANEPGRYLPQQAWTSNESLEMKRAVRTLERIGIGLCVLVGLGCVVRAFFVKPTPGK